MADDAKFTADWISEIDGAEKWQKEYFARCRRIIKRYRDERLNRDNQRNQDKKRFPILWSNVQTLGPAVYAKPPEVVVTRRYRDSDPIGRYASEVLERAIGFSCDSYDFDDRIKLCRDDFLLIGRGQAWIRYVPHVEERAPQSQAGQDPEVTNDAEEASEPQAYAEVIADHLSFDDYLYTPCREWAEVWWNARRVFMDRPQLIGRFGKLGATIPLDWGPGADDRMDEETKERVKKAAVYEIWDKRHGEVVWVSKAYKVAPLDRRPDWLNLDGFFPCPRPLLATTPQDKLIPVPDFVYYQDQAEELDDLTAKIGRLIDAIKTSGFYAGEANVKLQNLFASEINQLIPIDNMAGLQEKGGMKGLIEWFPMEPVATALNLAMEARKQVLQDIYEITGMSDIVRGSSDPEETATGVSLKAQWGSIRVREKQAELARFARDIMRLKGEIIARKFQPQTLMAMTDVQLPTNAEKQAATQQQAAQAQMAQQAPPQAQGQPGAPPQPQPQQPPQAPASGAAGGQSENILTLPSWEDVDGLLKNDALRSFRVDIETDSTVQPDENEEKARRVEFVTAMSALIGAALPVLQQYPPAAQLIGQTASFLARGFRVGREMEDVIEKTFAGIGQMQPAPQGQQTGPTPQELQLKQMELQLKQQELQFKQQEAQANLQVDAAGVQAEQQRTQADFQLGVMDAQLQHRGQTLDHINNQQQAQVAQLRPVTGGR